MPTEEGATAYHIGFFRVMTQDSDDASNIGVPESFMVRIFWNLDLLQ